MSFLHNLYHWVMAATSHHASDTPAPNPPAVTPAPIAILPEPAEAGSTITLTGDDTCTPEEISRIPQIVAAIYKAILDPKFKEYFCDPANGLDLGQTNGLTAEQVVNVIRTTKVVAVLSFYYAGFSKVIGYRNPDENIIHCNRKYHDGYTPEQEADNDLHEITHLMNFDHDFDLTPRRPFSVPYMANKAFEYVMGISAD